MAEAKQTEIPQEMRAFVSQNIDQAHDACKQLMDAALKVQDMMKSMVPANPAVAGLTEVAERAMRFTQQNLDAGFSLAHELAKAKDMTEMLQIQNRHAQLQMHAYALQAQELGTLLNIALQKAKPGV
ncbi:MAG: phasin family protein [Rhodomicrobium sp.]|jgi:phasin